MTTAAKHIKDNPCLFSTTSTTLRVPLHHYDDYHYHYHYFQFLLTNLFFWRPLQVRPRPLKDPQARNSWDSSARFITGGMLFFSSNQQYTEEIYIRYIVDLFKRKSKSPRCLLTSCIPCFHVLKLSHVEREVQAATTKLLPGKSPRFQLQPPLLLTI